MLEKTLQNDILVIADQQDLIGFTIAHIYTENPEIANIGFTGVDPAYRGRGIVGQMMEQLEIELKRRKVEYLTRNTRTEQGYADAIERYYGDRITESKDELGVDPKRYFRIKL